MSIAADFRRFLASALPPILLALAVLVFLPVALAADTAAPTSSEEPGLNTKRHRLTTAYANNLSPVTGKEETGADKTPPLPTQSDITAIRHSFADGKARVVIESSRPTTFMSNVLAATATEPARLYIDFAATAIRDKNLATVLVNNPILHQVRIGQYTKETTRVVLDANHFAGYTVSSQSNPFRVVVDLWDETGASAETKKTSPPVVEAKKPAPIEAEAKKPVHAETKTAATPQEPKKIPAMPAAPATPIIPPAEKKPAASASAATAPSPAQKPGPATTAKAINHPLKVIIDPGHGGRDPGTISPGGIKEKDIVLKVAMSLASELQRQPTSFRIFLTRDTDRYLSLDERAEFANRTQGDLFISIHVNSHTQASVHGVETYFLSMTANSDEMRAAAQENATAQSQISELQTILQDLAQNSKITDSARLAEAVQGAIVTGLSRKHGGIRNLGVKKAPFIVLAGTQMPAILTEIAFLSNADEASRLQDDGYLTEIAGHIATGLGRFASGATASEANPAASKPPAPRYALDAKQKQVQILP